MISPLGNYLIVFFLVKPDYHCDFLGLKLIGLRPIDFTFFWPVEPWSEAKIFFYSFLFTFSLPQARADTTLRYLLHGFKCMNQAEIIN